MSGGGARSGDARDVARLRAESVAHTREAQLDAEVNRLLRELLANFNDRDTELVQDRLNVAKEALGDAVEGSLDLLFGGSIAKHTYVDGLSDVDALVIVDQEKLGGASPAEVLSSFADALAMTHASAGVAVERGKLAVTLTYPDGSQIQLLPAVRVGAGLAIADESGKSWSRISPRGFAEKLTHVNTANGNQVVPTIKLAKKLVASLPSNRQVSGYHLESLAIEAFEGYEGRHTVKEMLAHFFHHASGRVLAPIRDSTGQSVHVDADLGAPRSVERRLVSDSFARLGRRLEYATSLAQWAALFDNR